MSGFPNIRVAVGQQDRTVIKGRVVARFPAQTWGANGIKVTKAAGAYTIANDWGALVEASTVALPTRTFLPAYVAASGESPEAFERIAFAAFVLAVAGAVDLDDLADAIHAAGLVGDMFKATYDTNNSGTVDASEHSPWSGLTGIPAAIDAIDGLTPAADRLAYYTGTGTADLATFTSFARTFSAYSDAAAAFAGIKQAASDTVTGVVELATNAETITGTDTARAVTPANVAAKTVKDWISVLIEKPANQDYVISRNIPLGCTVNSITTKCASGTCTVTGKINTTALGGTANSVSSSETTQAQASANIAAVGDDLVLTVSANATCLRLEATVAITRALGT
jgi:hypothetical protein